MARIQNKNRAEKFKYIAPSRIVRPLANNAQDELLALNLVRWEIESGYPLPVALSKHLLQFLKEFNARKKENVIVNKVNEIALKGHPVAKSPSCKSIDPIKSQTAYEATATALRELFPKLKADNVTRIYLKAKKTYRENNGESPAPPPKKGIEG